MSLLSQKIDESMKYSFYGLLKSITDLQSDGG